MAKKKVAKKKPANAVLELDSLTGVKKAIREKGLDWIAGDTGVPPQSLGLAIDDDELPKLGSYLADSEALADFQETSGTPPSKDWREGGWVTPVKHQGRCGSCVAFGTVAMIESRLRIACNRPNLDINLSEAHIFSGAGGRCRTGMQIIPAFRFCETNGVGFERDFSYQDFDQRPKYVSDRVSVSVASNPRLATRAERKHAIFNKGPVIGALKVSRAFRERYKGGVYSHPGGGFESLGHVITVVGYDDNDCGGCWIIKNSWGTQWGDNGFGRVAYDDVSLKFFPFYEVDVACPPNIGKSTGRDGSNVSAALYLPELKDVLHACQNRSILLRHLEFEVCEGIGGLRSQHPAVIRVGERVKQILDHLPPVYRAWFCENVTRMS